MVISPTQFSKEKMSGSVLLPVVLALLSVLATVLTSYVLMQEKKAIITKRTELAQLQRDLKLLDEVLIDQKNNKEAIVAATKTLPATFEEVAFFVSQIERIATTSGQKLETKIEEAANPEQNDLLSLGISLKTSGTYNSFSKMLTDLAYLPYHTKVDSLKLEESGGKISTLTNLRLYLSKKGVE